MTTVTLRQRAVRKEFSAWEQWYRRRDYRRMPWYSPRPSPWLVRALRERQLPSRGSVLDIGCGTGTNAIWLAGHGYRVVGVDVAPTALAVARARAQRAGVTVELRVASADRLPYPRGRFDFALDTGCFHSLPLRLRAAYARQLARVIRPRGHLLLTWIPREVQVDVGPPHRPSLEEVAAVFEPCFLFREVLGFDSGSPQGWKVFDRRLGRSTALLERRRHRQPPPR